MNYHVILTKECNLFCGYCGGGSFAPPKEVQYSVADLRSFLARDPDPVVGFYGGEPMIRQRLMGEMMDTIPARFVVQTNGLFLDGLDQRYLERLRAILVSIDGTKEVTDGERGRGVYERVVRNVALIRKHGFRGDVVARMTVVRGTNVAENVRHLMATGLFDHIHWQLDFGMFWEAGEDTEPGVEEWLASYNSGISSLVRSWLDDMARLRRVDGLVPFIGVMRSLLDGTPSGMRCGSGLDFFTVVPDGRISACPVSVDYDFSVVGSIHDSSPDSLRGAVTVGDPCSSCDVLDVCGGRCLFVNKAQWLLRENGYQMICSTVRHLIGEMEAALPRVRSFIDEGLVKPSDFDYPEFNNGCEIIP
jgi:uncharacterized protein